MKQFSEASKVALMLLALALPAVAQKPTIQLLPFTSFFVPAADACGFGVLFTPEPGRPNGERLIQFVKRCESQRRDNCRTALCDTNERQQRKNCQREHQRACPDWRLWHQRQNRRELRPGHSGRPASECGDSGWAAAPATLPWPGRIHD